MPGKTNKMSVDYEQLKTLVKEAMFTGGGINYPSAPVDVPHRMPVPLVMKRNKNAGILKPTSSMKKRLLPAALPKI